MVWCGVVWCGVVWCGVVIGNEYGDWLMFLADESSGCGEKFGDYDTCPDADAIPERPRGQLPCVVNV